jgi:sn-glycerol 3-phosphate transport system ATP-binding protein
MNIVALEADGEVAVIRGTTGPALLRSRGGDLMLGIRPEAISLGDKGVPAVVDALEFLGADTLVTCVIGSERVTVRVPGRFAVAGGFPVRLSWRAEDMHLFDAVGGQRRDDLAHAATGIGKELGLTI